MRRCLAHWPEKVPHIFRMLDLIAHGAAGRGPVHLLLTSAAEIAWDGDLDSSCPPPAQDAFGAYPTFSECYV